MNRVYLYPKSCKNVSYQTDTKIEQKQTNYGVKNCIIRSCKTREVVTDKPVENKSNILFINPDVMTDGYDESFKLVDGSYVNWDPRLYSASHGQYIKLDKPPIASNPKLNSIYEDTYKCYGKNYSTYSDINAGNWMYYSTKEQAKPYFKPNFIDKAEVTTSIFQDPMGSIKPEYTRTVEYTNPINRPNCDYSPYCLSDLADTNTHRQDIMSGLVSKMNQRKCTARYP